MARLSNWLLTGPTEWTLGCGYQPGVEIGRCGSPGVPEFLMRARNHEWGRLLSVRVCQTSVTSNEGEGVGRVRLMTWPR
jgi:hypothetical protein